MQRQSKNVHQHHNIIFGNPVCVKAKQRTVELKNWSTSPEWSHASTHVDDSSSSLALSKKLLWIRSDVTHPSAGHKTRVSAETLRLRRKKVNE